MSGFLWVSAGEIYHVEHRLDNKRACFLWGPWGFCIEWIFWAKFGNVEASLQFAVAVERVVILSSTWYENIMEGFPVFERMFYFSLGLGSFAAIISITLALSGNCLFGSLVNCSTCFLFNFVFSGLGYCDHALHFFLKIVGKLLLCCSVCCPRCCPGHEVFPDVSVQAFQADSHAHQEEGRQDDSDDGGHQLCLLEEGHGPEAHYQGRWDWVLFHATF